jgi:hypothetical protein
MGNEPNKQQGPQGQSQSHQQGQQSHQQGQQDSAGANTSDKWKSNQPQPGGIDPKHSQDMSKKDPSRQPTSTEQNDQEESDQKRRAS